MSGMPMWWGKRVGGPIVINGRRGKLLDGYCVSCRRGVPNSDELVLVTSIGTFNTSDDGVQWRFPYD